MGVSGPLRRLHLLSMTSSSDLQPRLRRRRTLLCPVEGRQSNIGGLSTALQNAVDKPLMPALQKHYYPNVVRAANVISRALSTQESDISELLELSSYALFEKEMKKKFHTVPLEFEPAQGLLGKKHDITAEHFSL
ncbi:unnamed protein product [Ranitomeya imitator]|uniref:Uncharacterized protein n=1 Tax=Ranitomeya imitator TaxID=111125 RepID=A0ABN9LP27_9NEOB|nr:unnamed protein product [Ranitomeya imitator]